MKHINRENAADMDADHAANPYNSLLDVGICRTCGQPCAWPDHRAEPVGIPSLCRICGKPTRQGPDGRFPIHASV